MATTPAKAAKADKNNSGMMLVTTFFAMFVVNAVVLFLANLIFPYFVVLGTISMDLIWAIIHSMAVLALIDTFAIPFIREYEQDVRGKMLTSKDWMMAYFLINLAGVWLVSRFSDQFGFGVRSWMVVVVLAVVFDLVQGVVMMQLAKLQKTS